MYSGGQQGAGGEGGELLLGKCQRALLEISTIFYFFARNSAIPLVQQYIYFLVASKYKFTQERVKPYLRFINSEGDGVVETAVVNISSLRAPGSHGGINGSDQGDLVTVPVPRSIRREAEEIIALGNIVNQESSLIVLYLTIAELLPSAVIVLFLGCWSDATGKRKFLMWLPCIGNALYALGFLLPIYINGGDIDSGATKALFVLACLCSGLSGNVPGYMSGNASYISDTDSPRRRTLRLAIVELSIGLTFGLSSLMNGYWVAASDRFDQPLIFVLVLSLIPFIILFAFLHEPGGEALGGETPHMVTSGSHLSSLPGADVFRKNFHGIRHIFGLRTTAQRKLWAIFVAYQIYVFVQQGQERTFVLFLQSRPLYWDTAQIGLFIFMLYTLAGLGCWPAVPLMQRCVSDLAIAALALVSKLIGSLLLAGALTSAVVYLAGVVQVFHLVPYAIARSLVSLQMGEDEQAKIFTDKITSHLTEKTANNGSVYALMHSVQSVVAFLGPVVHTTLFAATSTSHWSGMTFLISGPILIVPLLLLGYTRFLEHLEEELYGVDGSSQRTKPFSPSSLTPLSETTGFARFSAEQPIDSD